MASQQARPVFWPNEHLKRLKNHHAKAKNPRHAYIAELDARKVERFGPFSCGARE
jgi:hypothetical protein